ncbi:uncharacterized protein LOC111372938 [Olea europaea var. sylvestris]|uniref:uncharacterized protein LOC111372938 n=1 Tax=Olea europaea var. sylvestris TaxID=158386 RepID=UPI000C1D57C4|nr:uncharacterized protein LOC111372938 [Olea europaea var. sylvestris]
MASSQPIASITTWNDLAQKFYTKFFPPAKIAKLKHDISVFHQGDSENFDEAWNRFKNMLRKYPHHGISNGLQVQYFYAGLLPAFESMVDSSSNRSLSTKTIDEALKLFETVAPTSAVENMTQSTTVAQSKKASCEGCGAKHVTTECPILVQYQQPEKKPQLEEMFSKFIEKTNQHMEANNQFMRKTEATLQDQNAVIKNLKTQMGQMVVALTGRAPNSLPSYTKIKLKEHAKIEKSTLAEQLGKTQSKETVNPHEPPIPFPLRLKYSKLEQQYKKFLEVFKKLHINIPLAEALFQMPSYTKFLKDILSNKRKLGDHETIMKLSLGKAKATTVMLQLADRSLTHPRGIIEDVLVKVEKFIFPTNFLTLDMKKDKDIPLILGRPFLAIEEP